MTLSRIMTGQALSKKEATELVTIMMEGSLSNEEMAAILSVMQFRGLDAEEIAGFALGMEQKSKKIDVGFDVIDTCGTGGDASGTFNVSTAVAILLSSMQVKVAKHGNRSVSSKTGSADVLEKLGINFQQGEVEAKDALNKHGLTFLFAPHYHEAMRHVAPVRKALKMKTIFNVLGPLTNPAGAKRRVIGVYDVEVARKMAEASKSLSMERVLFVAGHDGLDEISPQTETTMIEVYQGEVTESTFRPEDAGLTRTTLDGAIVSDAEQSATLIEQVFAGNAPESATNLVLLNAGAALYVARKASTIKAGVAQAKEALGEQAIAHLQSMRAEKEVQS
ncbi:anthranilate phosphoribosyltransferase [Paenalkalicoccus suaedae]|uniref:Anthranilate phosphoribosyltransferase n=1 Tax=Paenalkalicoccus suaedae TaxID=2592382 RepID=A0A859FE20_9BACI|nr:anthranilate phosphoribosyltransferase [Paenalkalicoccus suaedae]QKS71098.1 anthranilate phosphoribosyltransferase [Paenalkalicoccus suaedae]